MFIALVGTPSAGKRSVRDYLVERHGFLAVDEDGLPPSDLLDHITRTWLTHTTTTTLRTHAELEPFVKRPFVLVVAVDGPLGVRYERELARGKVTSLADFVDTHDALLHPSPNGELPDLARVLSLAHIKVNNPYRSLADLHAALDRINLLNEERLRPGWDMYFMTLASLAAHRSNCMKRRVGAVLVRSNRIISTGYNGTPRGTRNCNHGGCPRCNGPAKGGEALSNCLCLHAEENALLEAGRERIGPDAVIYCNTCPCLLCSVKIVQCGVREVVYNQSYSMDTESAKVLKDGGVILRQMDMPDN